MPPFFVAQDNSSLHAGAVRGGGGGRAKRARPSAGPGRRMGWFCGRSPQNRRRPAPGPPPASVGAHDPKGRPGHCDPPLSLAISSPPQTIPFACTPAGNCLPARRSRAGGGGGRAKRARPSAGPGRRMGWFCGRSPQNRRRPAPGPPPASVGAHTPKAIGLNSCPKNAKKWPTATFLQCAILR